MDELKDLAGGSLMKQDLSGLGKSDFIKMGAFFIFSILVKFQQGDPVTLPFPDCQM